MAKQKTDTRELVRHLRRLEGQIAAIRFELSKETPECGKASATLRAASRSFASFRQAFVRCFLESGQGVARAGLKTDAEYEALLSVIKS